MTRGCVGLTILTAILLARGCAFRPATTYAGSHFNQGKNGVWLGAEWVGEAHSDAAITTLANDLAQHGIRYVFAYTSYLRTDTAAFNPKYTYAAEFVRIFKKAQPDIKLLAWLGLPMASLGGAANLADTAIRARIATLSAYFVHEIHFDGIQLDPEIVVSGDTDVISLLDETRQAIGSGAVLSLATEPIQPVLPDISLGDKVIGWSGDYYRQIAHHADQLAVMAYDSSLHVDWLYRELLRFEVIGITQAVNGTGTELLFGIPASAEITNTHDPSIENLDNGLQGVIDGLNDFDAVPSAVSGIAIYPAWEMDESKWARYNARWLGK